MVRTRSCGVMPLVMWVRVWLAAVRTYASRLRKVLDPGVLVSESGGYAVRVREGALDLGLAQEWVAEAEKARTAGDLTRAREVLNHALGLWDGEALVVTPAEVVTERAGYEVVADGTPVRLKLTDPDHLPHQVRLRVTGSVQHPLHHELPGGGGVWIFARRVPGVDGLTWTVRYDHGTDGEDPAIVAVTDQLVTAAQGDL